MFCRWLPGVHSVVAFKWLIIDEGPIVESLWQGIAALLPGMPIYVCMVSSFMRILRVTASQAG